MVVICSHSHQVAGKLRAIQNLDDMLAPQTMANFDGKRLATEHVNDGQSTGSYARKLVTA